MQRVGRGVAALAAGADRLPVAHRDLPELAARPHGDRAAVLLRAGHPVRETVIGRHVVDLRDRLVEPRAPFRRVGRSVQADDRALIARDDHDVRIGGVDPKLMIVVAARRAAHRPRAERFPAVLRSLNPDVRDVHDVGILRIDGDLLEVPTAAPHARVSRRLHPGRARVGRTVKTALFGVDHRVHDARAARRDRDPAASETVRGQPVRERLPRRPAVRRFVNAPAGSVRRGIGVPRRPPRVPERCVHDLRIRWIDRDVDGADAVVLVKHVLPRRAAVPGSEQTALCIGRVEMADRRDEHDVRVARIDSDSADVV